MSNKIGVNVVWSGLGFAVNKGGLMISILIASHFLPKEDYVHYSLFLIAVNVFSGIVSGSLSFMANRYSHKKSVIVGMWSTIQGMAVLSGLGYFFYATLNYNSGLWLNLIEALYVYGITYLASLNGVYFGQGRFMQYALINIGYGILSLLVAISLIIHGNYLLFLTALTIPLMIYLVWSSIYFLKKYPRLLPLRYIKRGIFQIFLPNLISGALFQPAILISAEMILMYSSESDLLAYSVANQFRMILMSLSVILGSVLIGQLVTAKDRSKTNQRNLSISYYPILVIAGGMALTTDYLFLMFAEMNLYEFVTNMQIVFFIVLISSVNSAISRNFVADEKGGIGILNNLTWLLTFAISSCFLIPMYGAIGANIAFLLASLVQFIIWFPYCIRRKYISFSFFNSAFIISGVLFLLIIGTKFFHWHPLVPVLLFAALCAFLWSRFFTIKGKLKENG